MDFSLHSVDSDSAGKPFPGLDLRVTAVVAQDQRDSVRTVPVYRVGEYLPHACFGLPNIQHAALPKVSEERQRNHQYGAFEGHNRDAHPDEEPAL